MLLKDKPIPTVNEVVTYTDEELSRKKFIIAQTTLENGEEQYRLLVCDPYQTTEFEISPEILLNLSSQINKFLKPKF